MACTRALALATCLAVAGTVSVAAPVTPEEAARFLAQATLGANWEEIHYAASIGPEEWLEEQFEAPVGYHQPYLDDLARSGQELGPEHRRFSWWEQVMDGPDPLRQRVALALSEIFVVSDELGDIRENPRGLANYYDMLLGHAFGNYRDLLRDVSLHPVMGVYLSHLRNEKSDPSRGRFPDENYAREIMQLFSIGLFLLEPDGSFVMDGTGQPIPTYDNDDITEMAKIFTGFSASAARRPRLPRRPALLGPSRCGCTRPTTSRDRSSSCARSSCPPASPACGISRTRSTTCSSTPTSARSSGGA